MGRGSGARCALSAVLAERSAATGRRGRRGGSVGVRSGHTGCLQPVRGPDEPSACLASVDRGSSRQPDSSATWKTSGGHAVRGDVGPSEGGGCGLAPIRCCAQKKSGVGGQQGTQVLWEKVSRTARCRVRTIHVQTTTQEHEVKGRLRCGRGTGGAGRERARGGTRPLRVLRGPMGDDRAAETLRVGQQRAPLAGAQGGCAVCPPRPQL